MSYFSFQRVFRDRKSQARAGIIITSHGNIETPAFVPVGTQATVKSLTPDELDQLGVRLFFVNTYHAYLRPGIEVIQMFGGIHRFMNWNKPIITDSGGFQIFSLGSKRHINIAISESAVLDRETFTNKQSKKDAQNVHVYPDDYRPIGELVKIDEDGVTFTSHWDGSIHRFTPEISMQIQHALGSDIMIAFDECAPYPTTYEYAKKAMERTHRWARRCSTHYNNTYHYNDRKQALYGVIQGGVYQDLRKESAGYITSLGCDGIAIGGVAVGESKEEMIAVLDWVAPVLPDNKPRHLLGVGEIDDIFALVEHGIDTFDCVQPTRLARMGHLYANEKYKINNDKFVIDITKNIYDKDTKSIDTACTCYTCRNFSRAYLHHLFRVRELLAYRLATIHNIAFVNRLMLQIRESIQEGTFLELKNKWLYNRK